MLSYVMVKVEDFAHIGCQHNSGLTYICEALLREP